MNELAKTKAPRGTAAEYAPGEIIPGTRYTYLRASTPGTRRGGARARALVQCSCGAEKSVYFEDLKRTHGCRSKDCRSRWDAACAFRSRLEAFLEDFLRTG